MTVYTSGDHIEKAILTGNPATFLQRPDGQDVDQHAEAQRMEYQAGAGLMILTGEARVWQTDGKEFRSEKIDLRHHQEHRQCRRQLRQRPGTHHAAAQTQTEDP